MISQKEGIQRWQNGVNNARGHAFENGIEAACKIYQMRGRARIEKAHEPFRVMKKDGSGMFTGRFTALAEPDYKGTLDGGKSFVMEAKYTSTDRMKRGVLTKEQMNALAEHAKLGAISAVCVGIRDKYFTVPWEVWDNMKKYYGRQYVTTDDLGQYRVKYNGAVMFLDFAGK